MRDQNISFLGLDMFSIAEKNRNNPQKVFDWIKAAKLIKEHKPKIAEAGLAGDWNYTGGVIWDNGPVLDTYTYLASTWATPTLIMDDEEFECFVMEQDTSYNSNTKWPQEALDILKE